MIELTSLHKIEHLIQEGVTVHSALIVKGRSIESPNKSRHAAVGPVAAAASHC